MAQVLNALRNRIDLVRGTDLEKKVKEATSNENWGASSTLKNDIARATMSYEGYKEVMPLIWKRLSEDGKNWRIVFKTLLLLEHLFRLGSERVVQDARDRVFQIRTLQDFSHVDTEGKDCGAGVREKAKQLCELLSDQERIAELRKEAQQTNAKLHGANISESRFGTNMTGMGMGSDGSYDSDARYGRRSYDNDWDTRDSRDDGVRTKPKSTKPYDFNGQGSFRDGDESATTGRAAKSGSSSKDKKKVSKKKTHDSDEEADSHPSKRDDDDDDGDLSASKKKVGKRDDDDDDDSSAHKKRVDKKKHSSAKKSTKASVGSDEDRSPDEYVKPARTSTGTKVKKPAKRVDSGDEDNFDDSPPKRASTKPAKIKPSSSKPASKSTKIAPPVDDEAAFDAAFDDAFPDEEPAKPAPVRSTPAKSKPQSKAQPQSSFNADFDADFSQMQSAPSNNDFAAFTSSPARGSVDPFGGQDPFASPSMQPQRSQQLPRGASQHHFQQQASIPASNSFSAGFDMMDQPFSGQSSAPAPSDFDIVSAVSQNKPRQNDDFSDFTSASGSPASQPARGAAKSAAAPARKDQLWDNGLINLSNLSIEPVAAPKPADKKDSSGGSFIDLGPSRRTGPSFGGPAQPARSANPYGLDSLAGSSVHSGMGMMGFGGPAPAGAPYPGMMGGGYGQPMMGGPPMGMGMNMQPMGMGMNMGMGMGNPAMGYPYPQQQRQAPW